MSASTIPTRKERKERIDNENKTIRERLVDLKFELHDAIKQLKKGCSALASGKTRASIASGIESLIEQQTDLQVIIDQFISQDLEEADVRINELESLLAKRNVDLEETIDELTTLTSKYELLKMKHECLREQARPILSLYVEPTE